MTEANPWKRLFSRTFDTELGRLHFAAHSHHPWPDVSLDAQQRAWHDAARLLDDKWGAVMGELLPRAQGHVARTLGWSRPECIAFAPNTHEFVLRILSCLEGDGPHRILSTDGEFHSFARQTARLEEAGRIEVERIPTEPFETFPSRFAAAARAGRHDLIFVSQVFFNSGYVYREVFDLAREIDESTYFVVDGYHGFMALPTDLGPVEDRIFYLSGGYKYAMSGEGVCFVCVPPGYAARPENTGWFASFGALAGPRDDASVPFSNDGYRMFGSTFDPTGLYRLVAVMDMLDEEGISVKAIHDHVTALQRSFLERLDGSPGLKAVGLQPDALIPGTEFAERGHFLTFRVAFAGDSYALLKTARVITDYRDDRWRFGFGIYQDQSDLDELFRRIQSTEVPLRG